MRRYLIVYILLAPFIFFMGFFSRPCPKIYVDLTVDPADEFKHVKGESFYLEKEGKVLHGEVKEFEKIGTTLKETTIQFEHGIKGESLTKWRIPHFGK